eukprot:gene1086-10605_t
MSDDEGTLSKGKLKKKQQHEIKSLKQKNDQAIKSAGKDKKKKKEMEVENEKKMKELLKKHEEEMSKFDNDETKESEEVEKIEEKKPTEEELEKIKKKEKNKRRNENKKQKEIENRKKVEEEIKNAGGTERQIELNAIQKQLNELSLEMKLIASDGHCLYRAISDQLQEKDLDYLKVRKLIADELRKNGNEYMPFLESSNGDMMNENEYKIYCDKVEKSSEWGGQVELKAAVIVFKRQIKIFTADSQPIMMGEEFEKNGTLNLSFHRKFYSLGEHYNSIIKIE